MAAAVRADTLVLEGGMRTTVEVTQERTFAVPGGGLRKLVFRFANPASFDSRTVRQRTGDYRLDFSPRPLSVETETDRFGNSFTVATWRDVKGEVRVTGRFMTELRIGLAPLSSSAPFPLDAARIPADVRTFLAPTKLVQSDAEEIGALARRLTDGAGSEEAAVMALLNWVVDNIRYKTPIPAYDALWTLRKGHGNCQNFSHLSMALLRSVGVPARMVGGLSLGKTWKVPLEKGSLVQSIGQGGHAWIEVWYPDLGWLAYDTQQSHLFVSPRHIKQTVGLDSMDINDSWRASPVLPPFSEEVSADYRSDTIEISLKKRTASPDSYIVTTELEAAAGGPAERPRPRRRPPAVKRPKRPAGTPVEFGNMDFPSLLDLYVKLKDSETGYRTLDKETAEYLTKDHSLAQAFEIEEPILLDRVSLALHKFGGRLGSLWIDIVEDDGGKPGLQGVRSYPLSLDTVSYYGGYKWFDFTFAKDPSERPLLGPGRYWIIPRRSEDAIVNWFYIPGNPYGTADDTRSTTRGLDWSDVLNYDFNFRVSGVTAAP
ncbi:MAG TPA: transglutaminase domain-containing protein [Deltaproteobacteria bacterium]|nr:transglutaminase domain-containing protein [Deltaproteobacteria bacterium]